MDLMNSDKSWSKFTILQKITGIFSLIKIIIDHDLKFTPTKAVTKIYW